MYRYGQKQNKISWENVAYGVIIVMDAVAIVALLKITFYL